MIDFRAQTIKLRNFKTLDKEVLNCHKCSGLNIPEETMNAGIGYGSTHADLLVVGQSLHSYNSETPDRQIPFVGPVKRMDSGKILYEGLSKAGYSFENRNLFVTNTVMCHTPGNRPSKPKEIENCRPYLESLINVMKPKFILTLGSEAREWFEFPRQENGRFASIFFHSSEYLNKMLDLNLMGFIVSVHPSYILRFGNMHRQKYIDQLIECLEATKEAKY